MKMWFVRILVTVQLLLVVGCGGTVGGVNPAGLPVGSSSFDPPEPVSWTLPNGLKVLYLHNVELPVVAGGLYLPGGSLWEGNSEIGKFVLMVFGFCISDCSGTESNANALQAATVMEDLAFHHSCHGISCGQNGSGHPKLHRVSVVAGVPCRQCRSYQNAKINVDRHLF